VQQETGRKKEKEFYSSHWKIFENFSK